MSSPENPVSAIRDLTLRMLAFKPETRLTASDIVEEFGDIRVTNYVIKCETPIMTQVYWYFWATEFSTKRNGKDAVQSVRRTKPKFD